MIRTERLEEQWSEIVSNIHLSVDWQRRIEELAGNADERANIVKEREDVGEQIRRIGRLYRDLLINETEYVATRDKLQQSLSTLVVPDEKQSFEAGKYLESLGPLWASATLAEKREITRILLLAVNVDINASNF